MQAQERATDPLQVLLVNYQEMFRGLVKETLSKGLTFNVVGEAAIGAEAIALTETLSPDVVIMDVHMDDMTGIEAALRWDRSTPALLINMLFYDDSLTRRKITDV